MSRAVAPGNAVAVVVCRQGRLPAGADEAVAEAGGRAIVVGTGASAVAGAGSGPGTGLAATLPSAVEVRWAETAPELTASCGALARSLAPQLTKAAMVVLPASPDGRDLAPHLAAQLGAPLLAGAVRAELIPAEAVRADLLRADGRVVVTATCHGAAVVSLLPGSRGPQPAPGAPDVRPLRLEPAAVPGPVTGSELIEPDPATMDLADARRVLCGGAGLVPRGATDAQAQALFALLADVAATLGASAGATRVVTDAGWMGYDRQIGTTGVTVDPDLYVAMGVSGATQHVGGIGAPLDTVSVNTDPSCPMTALADLGVVADAPRVLVDLASKLGVQVAVELLEMFK